MKQIAVCLTLMAVALLAAKPADAAIVIDNFSGPGGTATGNTDTPITRTLAYGGTGFASLPGAGGLSATSGAEGFTFTLTYAIGNGIPNPSGFGYFSTLHLTGLTVSGDWNVTFSTANGLGGPVGISKSPVAILNGATEAFIDLYNNTHATNLNSLSDLVLTFTNITEGGGFQISSGAGITAVPEPVTMALLLPTLAGGIGMAWRRRKNNAVSETSV